MKVLIVCGSQSDSQIADQAAQVLKDNDISYELQIASAHREPDKVRELIKSSNADVFIAIAGLSAALPGIIASLTDKPVIGVPVNSTNSVLGGLDSLLSISQMPPGVPVAAVGINNAKNAAYLAMRILKLKNDVKNNAILIKKGKVKNIYDIGDGKLMFEFSDRVSAFDVVLPSEIPFKGEVLCRLSEFFFKTLNVPNHMIETIKPNKMIAKKLSLIPIECVVRGYLYGSLFERVQNGEVRLPIEPILATKLPEPFFDPTTKFEKKDRQITKEEILENWWLTEKEFEWIKQKSIELYKKIAEIGDRAGFIVADIKFEFGKDENGNILLADSIGPDEFRMWSKEKYSPGRSQEAFDKQIVRDWLIEIGFKNSLDEARKLGKELPQSPELDPNLINKLTNTYIFVFEKLTGEKFR
jgi:phosphoribosylaminoimidazole-succinocarboxamide synthase